MEEFDKTSQTVCALSKAKGMVQNMKTLLEKKVKIKKYKDDGGKVVITLTNEEGDTVKQEIRTKNQEKFENIVADQLSPVPNQPAISMKTDN